MDKQVIHLIKKEENRICAEKFLFCLIIAFIFFIIFFIKIYIDIQNKN